VGAPSSARSYGDDAGSADDTDQDAE